MPEARAAEVANAWPFEETLYHLMSVPVAGRFATVGLLPEQNVCGLLAKGAAGVVFTVTVTAVSGPSQPFVVCEA